MSDTVFQYESRFSNSTYSLEQHLRTHWNSALQRFQLKKAPKLLESKEVDCSQYPDAFLPEKRESSARIGHMIQLGFDVDTLKVHLNELADVVDYFFITEWTDSHNKQVSHKPLTWEAIKKQPRFEKFQDKVVHFILDDVDTMIVTNNDGQWAQ